MRRRWAYATGLALAGLATVTLSQDRETTAARGRQLFFDRGCYTCHTMGATGTPIAPDLSRVGARYRDAQLADWLRDPARQKPTTHMPRIELSEADIAALVAFFAAAVGR